MGKLSKLHTFKAEFISEDVDGGRPNALFEPNGQGIPL